jgi:hypothetical protein
MTWRAISARLYTLADLGRGFPKIEQIKLEDNDLTGMAQYQT